MQQASAESLWRDGLDLGVAPLSGDIVTDVCVVGLGGSGLSALDEFRRAGLRCVGLDRGGIAAGAAGANGGFLLAGQAAFYHVASARFGVERARGIYELTQRELARRYRDAPSLCRRTGSLRIAADSREEADCARQIEAMQRDGLPAQPYLGAEGHGVLFPEDGMFDPAAYWRELAMTLTANGVALYGGTNVIGVAAGVVTTTTARVRADRVVVAVDGGLENLLPQLAGEVRSARLQMLATVPDAQVQVVRPVYFRDGHDYWLQRDDGCIALGGGRDVGGDDEWQLRGISLRVQAHLETLLRDRLRSRAAITHRWSAAVAFTQRGLPVFGEIAPGVFVTGAYDGTGNLLGALCGRALARLALGERGELAEWLANERG